MKASPSFEQRAFFRSCRQLIKEQKLAAAFSSIRQALSRHQLDARGISQAGRLLDKLAIPKNSDIAILGQFTTAYLSPVLKAVAAIDGEMLSIEAASYDNVLQSLWSWDRPFDAIILIPWHQRLIQPGPRSSHQRVEEELGFWQQAWQLISKQGHARIVQVGYDWIDAGAAGSFLAGQPDGAIGLIRAMNQQIRNNLPRSAYFVDLEQVSGILGRQQFYDARSYYWTKQPLSEQGTVLLSHHLWAGIRATRKGPKKVLVLDLDHTLWGGVVGEVGAQRVELGDTPTGEAYRTFQQLIKQLGDQGCVLAVCSKNNDADAKEPFQHNADMVLKLDDFAAFKTGWGPKSEAIRQMAEGLKLGLDSFLFFDDSKFERDEVRMTLPQVTVVEVPPDPCDYRQALLQGLWFESVHRTSEDGQRSKYYRHERERVQTKSTYHTVEDYLASLNMTADVRPLNEADMERVVQLLGKTNQFNLTSRRHRREDVLAMLAKDGSFGLTLRLKDKFGDYGLVSVMLTTEAHSNRRKTLVIDSWLMSCRAIGRTVEHCLFNCLLDEARIRHFQRIEGEYIPTPKNMLVKTLYQDLGCTAIQQDGQASQWYELDLDHASLATTFVHRSSSND